MKCYDEATGRMEGRYGQFDCAVNWNKVKEF